MRRCDVGDGPCAVPWRDRGFQITQTGITKACTGNGAGFCLYRRFPFSLYAVGFIVARPRGHGDGDGAEWFSVVGAKLEVGALRYGEGYVGSEGGDFFAVALFAPHFALSADDVPDFFDGVMGNGDGCFSRGEFKVGHAAVFEFEEYADV